MHDQQVSTVAVNVAVDLVERSLAASEVLG